MPEPPLGTLLDRLHRRDGSAGRDPGRDADGATETRRAEPGLRPDDGEAEDAHLAAVPDGAGCAEIWEHLSERGAPEAGAVADD